MKQKQSVAFGDRVKELMEGMTLREVAQRASDGLCFTTVRDMRNGVIPNPMLIVSFSLAVGADPDELLRLAETSLRFDWDAYNQRREQAEREAQQAAEAR